MKKTDLSRWGRYFEARNAGKDVAAAARVSRVSLSVAYQFERNDPRSTGLEAASLLGVSMVAGMLVDQPLSVEAKRALDDFAFFRRRYFGRESTPWQVRAAYDCLKAVESAERDYLVINVPPGSGKSTLFTCDIPTWLIARDRTIRIQVGSRTERQARMYVTRIKRALEREAPLRADAESLAKGVAHDADACLVDDFGPFKPEGRSDLWAANALVVRQADQTQLDDKEPTLSAWGQDSGFLGGRFDFIIWDDLVDQRNTRTEEARDKLIEWYSTEAETRLEPGGALVLQGQRIHRSDLYRYALDLRVENEAGQEVPKYKHIIYRAHDDTICTGEHLGLEPWPKSCLIDPHRLPWKVLDAARRNNPRVFEVQYQQQDGDVVGGLVDPAWIFGGVDADGYPAVGCQDSERMFGVVPDHLKDGKGWSFITVDPSPTEWWGIIWWVYDPETQNRYIVEIHRERLGPEQFLSLDLDKFEFSGLMVDMRVRSIEAEAPISHVIVEVNAAQRWLLQQPHVQRWMQTTGVIFVPHTTSVNKANPEYGVESLGDYFRQGKIRIPSKGPLSKRRAEPFVSELLAYPDGDTDDLVMSCWFHTLAVNNHYAPKQARLYRQKRPSWVSSGRGLAWAR